MLSLESLLSCVSLLSLGDYRTAFLGIILHEVILVSCSLFETMSFSSSGWSGTHYVDRIGFKLIEICLPLKGWELKACTPYTWSCLGMIINTVFCMCICLLYLFTYFLSQIFVMCPRLAQNSHPVFPPQSPKYWQYKNRNTIILKYSLLFKIVLGLEL